jgi:hypothetical protein
LALLAALFSISVFCGFFFSSFFLSSPLLMLFTPYVRVISSRGTPHVTTDYAASNPSVRQANFRVLRILKRRNQGKQNLEVPTRHLRSDLDL